MQSPVPSRTTLVAAVDPGKVTGLSYLAVSQEAITTPQAHEMPVAQFFLHFAETFYRVDDSPSLDLIVVTEKFQISERTIKTALSLDALDVNGWLKGEQLYLRNRPFYEQTAAQAKKFSTDQKLKALGWFERTKDGHANDANRHLLRFVMNSDWPIRDHLTASLAKELLK